jgi:hypothetical protein
LPYKCLDKAEQITPFLNKSSVPVYTHLNYFSEERQSVESSLIILFENNAGEQFELNLEKVADGIYDATLTALTNSGDTSLDLRSISFNFNSQNDSTSQLNAIQVTGLGESQKTVNPNKISEGKFGKSDVEWVISDGGAEFVDSVTLTLENFDPSGLEGIFIDVTGAKGNSTLAAEIKFPDFTVNKYFLNALDGQSIPDIEGLGPVLLPDIEAGSDGDFKTEGVFHIEIDDLADSETIGGRFRDVVDSALKVTKVLANGVDITAEALDSSTNTIDYSFGPLGTQNLKVDVHYEFDAQDTETVDITVFTGVSNQTNDYSLRKLDYQAYLLKKIDAVSGNTYSLNGTRSNTVEVFNGDQVITGEASIGIVTGTLKGVLANGASTHINFFDQTNTRGSDRWGWSSGYFTNSSDIGTNGSVNSGELFFSTEVPPFSDDTETARSVLSAQNFLASEFESGFLDLDAQVGNAFIPIIAAASDDVNVLFLDYAVSNDAQTLIDGAPPNSVLYVINYLEGGAIFIDDLNATTSNIEAIRFFSGSVFDVNTEVSGTIAAGNQSATIIGGPALDNVETVFGGTSGDLLDFRASSIGVEAYGDQGGDLIVGSDFDDILNGEEGPDQIVAGAGNDLLIGGQGPDEFYIEANSSATINDFENTDTIFLVGLASNNVTISGDSITFNGSEIVKTNGYSLSSNDVIFGASLPV